MAPALPVEDNPAFILDALDKSLHPAPIHFFAHVRGHIYSYSELPYLTLICTCFIFGYFQPFWLFSSFSCVLYSVYSPLRSHITNYSVIIRNDLFPPVLDVSIFLLVFRHFPNCYSHVWFVVLRSFCTFLLFVRVAISPFSLFVLGSSFLPLPSHTLLFPSFYYSRMYLLPFYICVRLFVFRPLCSNFIECRDAHFCVPTKPSC